MSSEALLERVRARIAQERGVVATLRALPTRWRMALAASFAGLLVLAPLAIVRPPLELGGRAMVVMVGYVALAALLVSSALQPTQEVRNPTSATVLVVLALVLPGVAVWLGPGFVERSAPQPQYCLAFGVLGGWGLVLLLRALDRTESRTLLAVGLGSIVTNLGLHFHCPSTDVGHRLACHGAVGVLMLVQLLVVRWARRSKSA